MSATDFDVCFRRSSPIDLGTDVRCCREKILVLQDPLCKLVDDLNLSVYKLSAMFKSKLDSYSPQMRPYMSPKYESISTTLSFL